MRLPIYLDNAATTPVDPRVVACMSGYLDCDGAFGNPASNHSFGWRARQAVETAAEQVGGLIGADPDEIIWTSGATESNNLAIKGAAHYYAKKGRHIVTCKTEHRAVLDVCRELSRIGYEITYLDPEADGLLNLETLAAALRDDTVLVSLMQVNNEIGVVQDIAAIADLTHARGILLHVDAAQSAGKMSIDLRNLAVDLMSISAHKVYGPKGIGALYVRRKPRVRLTPQIHGGGHQRGLRAGTLASHQIVGMGAAFAIAKDELATEYSRIEALRERLWQGLQALPAIYYNGHPEHRVPGILNVSFAQVDGESLLLDLQEIALSSGSACSSAEQEPSHVLRALGLDYALAGSALRFGIGRFTSEEEIDYTIAAVQRSVQRLRTLSPLWEEQQR